MNFNPVAAMGTEVASRSRGLDRSRYVCGRHVRFNPYLKAAAAAIAKRIIRPCPEDKTLAWGVGVV
jgi:hypothetical protein